MGPDDVGLEPPVSYEPPSITEYGSLLEITESCFGSGGEDAGGKLGYSPFVNSVPFAPGFCL